jgi:hypothetical protein
MSSIEEIGALLGLAAFAGLAVLVFLTFQQARHLRRLREWAGRAPERAAAAAARETQLISEREGSEPASEEPERPPRFAGLRAGFSERWDELDRRMPVDPRVLLGGLAAVALGVGIATSGFGVLGGDDGAAERAGAGRGDKDGGKGSGGSGGGDQNPAVKVAVLNGTAPPGGQGVPGVADRVSQDVKAAGFRVGTVDNVGSYTSSVVMFNGSAQSDAEQLAEEMSTLLGSLAVVEMTPEVKALVNGANLALIVGQDDASI